MPLDWSVEGVSRSPKGNELDEWLDDETSWFREESSGMLFVLRQIFNCNSCVLCIVGKQCAVLLRDCHRDPATAAAAAEEEEEEEGGWWVHLPGSVRGQPLPTHGIRSYVLLYNSNDVLGRLL